VIIQEAKPSEIAPLIIDAYGLSPREARVTRLVLQGLSTKEIASEMDVSPYTVQDHLKTIFAKVGVRSRRELVATIFDQHHRPRFGLGENPPPGGAASTRMDFGHTADDYVRHRAGFPAELLDGLDALGLLRPDDRVVDLGTGTGNLARLIAPRVASVVGVDPSAALLEKARELGGGVEYHVGTAEDTGLPAGAFDLVTAGQCWHWFDGDRAAAEARRLLQPDGSIVIAHFDWIPLPGNVAHSTEALIERHNPRWTMGGGTGIYPRWLTDLARAGFEDLRTFSFDVVVPYRPEAWIGRIRASAGVGASLDEDQVERLSDDLRGLLAERHPEDPLKIPHRTWAVVARKRIKAN